MKSSPSVLRESLNWFLLASFFFMHYFVRISPSLIDVQLMKTFSITIKHIGWISSFYFITYTASQIPVGYLMKFYSSRFLIGSASLACGVCALAFTYATAFPTALLSLLCYAFFGAFGFVGAISYATKKIPQYASLFVGMTQSMGMAGGFIATNLITAQIQHHSWQSVIGQFPIALFMIGLAIFLIVPSDAQPSSESVNQGAAKPTVNIYCNSQTWFNALYAGCIYYPLMVLTEGGLGVSLLESIHHLGREQIAFAVSMVFIGWLIGGPFAGLVADKYGHRRVMLASSICGLLTIIPAIFLPLSSNMLSICLFTFGITNTGIVGCYSLAASMHGPENSSISVAIANMSTILIGSILGGILPMLLETHCNATFIDGIPYYQGADYQLIFGSAMIIALILSYVLGALVKTR
ncbi:MAG: MFS transporter [Gammaproteobacteria bacterium]|nr:MFS transporter [Gammaproteobacteria bacterium]